MPKQNIIWVVAILAGAAVTIWLTRHGPTPDSHAPSEDMPAVREAYRCIVREALEKDKGPQAQRRAIEGMVKAMDRFSSYVPPELLAAFNAHMEAGRESGLGLRFEALDSGVFVTGTMVDSPAHREGLAVGDQILSADSQELTGLSSAQVGLLLKPPPQTPLPLVIRSVDGFYRTLPLEPAEFDIKTVTGLFRSRDGRWVYRLDAPGGPAYVRVREFLKTTASDVAAVVEELKDAPSLVLDLRDNPGGPLESAVATADLFLNAGLIVRTVDREGRQQRIYAHELGTCRPMPMVVLVNERTASAAEIVAGALQANDRAVLMGQPTLGKNCAQTMFPLPEGMGWLNLTTKRFYLEEALPDAATRPEGAWHVVPHVIVPPNPKAPMLARRRAWAEASIPGRPATMPAASLPQELLDLDNALQQARNILAQPDRVRQVLDQARADRTVRNAATRPSPESQPHD
ncbi:MAG: S41 family peptidase [Planctomycetota bacterium]|nr:S41 family peptidase [Planctomycetota bacterium]